MRSNAYLTTTAWIESTRRLYRSLCALQQLSLWKLMPPQKDTLLANSSRSFYSFSLSGNLGRALYIK